MKTAHFKQNYRNLHTFNWNSRWKIYSVLETKMNWYNNKKLEVCLRDFNPPIFQRISRTFWKLNHLIVWKLKAKNFTKNELNRCFKLFQIFRISTSRGNSQWFTIISTITIIFWLPLKVPIVFFLYLKFSFGSLKISKYFSTKKVICCHVREWHHYLHTLILQIFFSVAYILPIAK